MCKSAEQCAERVADRENLVRELVDVAENALGVFISCCAPAGGVDDHEAILDAKRQIRHVLWRAKEQQGE